MSRRAAGSILPAARPRSGRPSLAGPVRGASVISSTLYFILVGIILTGIAALTYESNQAQKTAQILLDMRRIQAAFHNAYGTRTSYPVGSYTELFAADMHILPGIPRDSTRTKLLSPWNGTYTIDASAESFNIMATNIPKSVCVTLAKSVIGDNWTGMKFQTPSYWTWVGSSWFPMRIWQARDHCAFPVMGIGLSSR